MSTFSHSLYDTRFLKYKDGKIFFPGTGTVRPPIPKENIVRIILTKGRHTPHPIRTIIMGIGMIILPFIFNPFGENFIEIFEAEYVVDGAYDFLDLIGLFIEFGGMFIFLGVVAIIHATVKTPIFEIHLKSGKQRIVPIVRFKSQRDLRDIVDFFEIVFEDDQWYINERFDNH